MDAPDEGLKKNEAVIIAVLACVQVTHVLDFVLMMPLGPSLMRIFAINPQQFAFVVSSYTFSAAVSGFIGAFFLDRFDRKKALLVLFTGLTLGTVSCAMAPNYEMLVAARILTGAFGGVLGALIFAIIGDSIHPSRRGRATGIVSSAFSVASVCGVPLGLWLATHFNWHMPFAALASLGVLVLFYAGWKLPRMDGHVAAARSRNVLADFRHVAVDANHIRAFTLTIFMLLSAFSVIPFLAPYMVKNVGLSEGDLTWIYFFGGLATMFSSRYIGIWCDRRGKYPVFVWIASASVLPILLVTHLPVLPLPVVLLVTTFFMICVSGRFVPAMALITSSTTREHRGSFMSLNSSIHQLAAGMASVIAGALMTNAADGRLENFGHVGIMAVSCTLASLWLAGRIRERDGEASKTAAHE
jgi:predicted MFS family arabinose efflux permease